MVTEQQYALLTAHAQDINKSLSTLIRETIERNLIKELEQQRKREALEWMASQRLPVDDWDVMERQIESRWEGCWDE
jgi:hypothetical protein